eukprot:7589955-Ditylum_brightwellii.AAC.1
MSLIRIGAVHTCVARASGYSMCPAIVNVEGCEVFFDFASTTVVGLVSAFSSSTAATTICICGCQGADGA